MRSRVQLAVACLTMLTATALAGCQGTAPTPPVGPAPTFPPNLTLQPDNWDQGNLSILIIGVDRTTGIAITSLTYLILDQNGTAAFTGAAGTRSALGISISVSYTDATTTGSISIGDSFWIQIVPSDSTALELGTFEVQSGTDTIASVSI